MKTRCIHIVVLGWALLLVSCGKKEDPVVAEIQGHSITASEFAARYRAFLPTASERDNILQRRKILDNMINERLIRDDLKLQGLDNDPLARRRREDIELQALLDRYSRRVSTDTARVSEEELRQEFVNYNSKVSARYLYATTEEGAREMKRRLMQGETFERLAREVFDDPGLANNGGYLGSFGWGEMEPALEEQAFSLPVGAISDPVELSMGYAIVRVESRVRKPLSSEYDYAVNKQKMAQAVFERKTLDIIKQTVNEISSALNPSFNENALAVLLTHWSHVGGKEDRINEVSRQTGTPENLSDQQLVRFRDESWTIGDFLARVQRTTEKQRQRVSTREDLRDMVLGLAAREELIRRARKAGLESDTEVGSQIQRVWDEFLLRRWTSTVQDSVGRHGWPEAELRRLYEDQKHRYMFPPEVRVSEILVRTREEAGRLLTKIRDRESFAELARSRSIRLWAARRSGDLGFNTRAGFGIMGDKFFAATVGDVIGPEEVDPYYGLFMITEKREGKQKTFEEAREEIIASVRFMKQREVFQRALASLRRSSDISIDMEELARVEVATDVSTVKDQTP